MEMDNRPDPDRLLKQVESEEQNRKKGKLKIFFGYAAGVGKTYAMLQAARQAAAEGTDTVAGYVEPHARPETTALLDGLEVLPVREIPYKNILLKEFDLDAALARNPQLILVDELAHTNAPGSRHTKRYQDIQELLAAGITVYTTVNVQHLESLTDIVASFTGIVIHERIPDFVFDGADKIELVDIEPEELLARFQEGKVYRKQQAGRAMEHFFTIDNLQALREIALRRTADQVNLKTERMREQNRGSEYCTDEHILVCLSPSPSNAKVIRAAARMVKAFKARFSAVYVDSGRNKPLNSEDLMRLQMNEKLAEQLEARIITLFGESITGQIAEYARVAGVSKIVLGRSYTKHKKSSFSEQLAKLLPKLEIYLIPDTYSSAYRGKYSRKGRTAAVKNKEERQTHMMRDLAVLAAILAISTAAAVCFRALGLDDSNSIMIYILGILLTALITEKQIYSLFSVLGGVVCFNLLFTEPIGTLLVSQPGYFVTFGVMFAVGSTTALLAKKVKRYGRQAVRRSWRMETLLETNQQLQMAEGEDKIADVVCSQLCRLLGRDIIYFPGEPDRVKAKLYPLESGSQAELLTGEEEVAVAAWSYKNNKHAGAMTTTLPGAKGLYLAIRSDRRVFGVVGIRMGERQLSIFDESLLNGILGDAALAMERERTQEEKNIALIRMKQEETRLNLLSGVFHRLRQPVENVCRDSAELRRCGEELPEEKRRELYDELYENSASLSELAGHLLEILSAEKEGKKIYENSQKKQN